MPTYRTIDGVRFDTRISDKDVNKILEVLECPIDFKSGGESAFARTVHTGLEHSLEASSAPITVSPLTPYAYIAGTMTPEEINQKRKEWLCYGEPGEAHWSYGHDVSAPPEARKRLYEIVHERLSKPLFKDGSLDVCQLRELGYGARHEGKKISTEQEEMLRAYDASGMGKVMFWFAMAPMDPDTGITGLPYVSRIVLPDKSVIKDKPLLNKFSLIPQQDDSLTRHLQVHSRIDKRIKTYIDEVGYRFELRE